MTHKHKNRANGAPVGNEPKNPEDEKLFDFGKSFEGEQSISEESTDDKVKELETTLSELKEKHLRLLAEFDNYKKRTMRERLELLNSASRDVIMALLPVLDDFDRAKKSAEEGSAGEHFSEGVKLVYNRLYNVLQSFGLKAMESNDETFDPDLHDAITEVTVPDENVKGKIIDTLEKGYLLNDKIIRHAKVIVGK